MYLDMFGLDISEAKEVGGVGSFSLRGAFRNGKRLVVGEAAGLQDFLWGFGMRYAITSGYLAAKSIIDGSDDYETVAKKHFSRKLRAGVVNRYLWERFGENEYSFLLHNAWLVLFVLRSMHNYNLFQMMLYPIALRHLKRCYPQLRL